MEKPKPNPPKDPNAAAKPATPASSANPGKGGPISSPEKAAKPGAPAAPPKVAPMFRPIDWLTLAVTFGVIWIIYLCTLAPEQ
ncbi:MAG: hypothetical protein ABSH48_19195, partial [Verrucomicrobiota bacterium]